MSSQTLHCGKRLYMIESRVTKNGHKYIMITEKSSGRLSKVMVFHDHYEMFLSAVEKMMKAEPTSAADPEGRQVPEGR